MGKRTERKNGEGEDYQVARNFIYPYYKARSETEEKVHDAIEAAMAISSTSKATEDKGKELKRKTEEKAGIAIAFIFQKKEIILLIFG